MDAMMHKQRWHRSQTWQWWVQLFCWCQWAGAVSKTRFRYRACGKADCFFFATLFFLQLFTTNFQCTQSLTIRVRTSVIWRILLIFGGRIHNIKQTAAASITHIFLLKEYTHNNNNKTPPINFPNIPLIMTSEKIKQYSARFGFNKIQNWRLLVSVDFIYIIFLISLPFISCRKKILA
jgi:hypothetical protein